MGTRYIVGLPREPKEVHSWYVTLDLGYKYI